MSQTDLETPASSIICNQIITKEFLQRALEKEVNGSSSVSEIVAHSVTLGTKPGDNYMSIIYSVDVELSDRKKRHLLIKCYPNHLKRQKLINKSNMFFKEFEVYSKWIPELKRFQTEVLGLDKKNKIELPYAHFVHGDCIDFQSEEGKSRISQPIESLENFIVMEDLRKTYGFKMTNRREALNLDHMRLVIEALAKVHALSWAYRYHVQPKITDRFPCLVANMTIKDIVNWNNVLFVSLNEAKNIFNKTFGPENEYSAATDNFRRHVDTVSDFFLGNRTGEGLEKYFRIPIPDSAKFGKDSENPEPWCIICHGDCWSNNMLFRYDNTTGKPIEVVLVDLQVPQETCVVNDLQNVIYSCTRLELRRLHLDYLLQLYHDTFNNVCELTKTPTLPGFCMDSLRFRFHRSKFLGYYAAMMVLPLTLREDDQTSTTVVDEQNKKSIAEAFTELCSNVDGHGHNSFEERVIELTKGMMEDGVF